MHIFAPWKLSTILQFYLQDRENELGIFNKEYANNYRKKLPVLKLIEKTEIFIKKIWWKAVFNNIKLNNKNKKNNQLNNNMMDNTKNNGDSAQQVEHLTAFEEDIIE